MGRNDLAAFSAAGRHPAPWRAAWVIWLAASALPTFADDGSLSLGSGGASGVEAERTQQPAGNLYPAALEAYLSGTEAEAAGDAIGASEAYERANRLDGDFLAGRLALLRLLAWNDPPRASEAAREAWMIAERDFRAQRWLTANAVIGLGVAALCTVALVLIGLLARHIRALHHAISEAIGATLRSSRRTSWFALFFLLLPWAANLGLLVTLLFLTFVASFRFSRGERFLALGCAALLLFLAPLLLLSTPLWAPDPRGHDASSLAEAQQSPATVAHRSLAEEWARADATSGIPAYLRGLALGSTGRRDEAAAHYLRALETHDVPPRTLETNLGNAALAIGRRSAAIEHYRRAIDLEPDAFEPHYNLALVNAAGGRYRTADRDLERASRVDLDRLRALGRERASSSTSEPPLDALWTASELWAFTLGQRPPALAPGILTSPLPLASLAWATPLAAVAIGLGLAVGGGLRRLIRVHVCYQCATPVCRRCLVRIARRAYCSRCAEGLGGRSAEETTRALLRRLLDDRPEWSSRLGPVLTSLVPGVGPIVQGMPILGALTALAGGIGLALLLAPAWSHPLVPLPWPDPSHSLARFAGVILFALGIGLAATAGHWRQRRAGMRAFLSRDVDRLAA